MANSTLTSADEKRIRDIVKEILYKLFYKLYVKKGFWSD